ncbi:hypothetical protein ACFL07_02270 [Pseudomonadota bacterium]
MSESYTGHAVKTPRIRAPDPSLPWVIAFVAAAISFGFGAYWLSAVGVGAFAYYLVRLLQEAGVDLPIESFILVMASMQWIIGPVLDYAGLSNHWKYRMTVPAEEYMALAVPGVIALSLGLYAFRSKKRIGLVSHYAGITRDIVSRTQFLPFYLIGIGFIFSFLVHKFPPALAFPAYILSNIKYIGLIYLIFSHRQKNKGLILALAFFLTFVSSLRGAMFHDLLLWSAFIGMYAAYVFRPSNAQKALAMLMGLAFIFVLQAVKDDYRSKLREEGRGQNIQKFLSSVDERLIDDETANSSNVERLVIRINQGWIISAVMVNVPRTIPHAGGETIVTAIKTSALPRILYPDKPIAGGKANFEKYTGYLLQRSTSMGISLLGEAYINFGVRGAWVFMFFFGLFSSFVIKQFFLLASTYPTIWLWFPLILLHFVKAETELLVQLNFILKSIIMVYAFVWANKHFLRLKL